MAGPIKNGRLEIFAQELAKGTKQEEAYPLAGYRLDKGAASRAAARADVRARVTELQARAAAKVEVTVADIARQLDEDRAFAKQCGSAAAAVSATLGKAKVLGLIRDKVEHTGLLEVKTIERRIVDPRD